MANWDAIKLSGKPQSIEEKHGFFSKFLPEETLEIMKAMNERSPADLI